MSPRKPTRSVGEPAHSFTLCRFYGDENMTEGFMAIRQTGFVYRFDFEKGYGQISVNSRPRDGNRVYFHARGVEPDLIGRRSIPPNSPVSFDIAWGAGRETAINVRNLDPELKSIDPNKHEEFGQVKSWNGDAGYIIRPSNDTFRFTKRAIISEGAETIHVGTWLHYFIGRVQKDENQSVGFFARDVSVCLDPEPVADEIQSHFLQVEELPLDYPEGLLASEPVSVLNPSTRKLSLLEIMKRKRN
jgi:cold shock CspA family protein